LDREPDPETNTILLGNSCLPNEISCKNVIVKINFVLTLYYNSTLLGDPADYDELVAEDAGIEAGFGAGSEACPWRTPTLC
jgi:hypothetical protein